MLERDQRTIKNNQKGNEKKCHGNKNGFKKATKMGIRKIKTRKFIEQ